MRSSDPPRKSWWWKPNTALRLNFIGFTVGNLLSLLLFLLRMRKLVTDWLIHLFEGVPNTSFIGRKEGQCAHFVGFPNKWKRRPWISMCLFFCLPMCEILEYFSGIWPIIRMRKIRRWSFSVRVACACVFHVEFVRVYNNNAEQHDSPFFVWKFAILLISRFPV